MMTHKPIASLSLDLDNKWSYLKTHGDAGWETFPTYLDVVVPRFLEFFAERDLTITVFVVGQDAALDKNFDALASISAAGHEIGNHSFNHEPWLHLYKRDAIEFELAETEEHLQRVTSQRPIGFRGPGFSHSETVLEVLMQRGYEYDASTFPSFLGPLARAYYFLTSSLSAQQKQQRKILFGGLSEGFKPLRPYYHSIEGDRLLEIPVTTMPVFKIPIHVSYLLYLAQFSRLAAISYFRLAMTMCRMTAVAPSLLLHPLDFLGCDDERDLMFFPAMRSHSQTKIELVAEIIDLLARECHLTTMQEHAAAATEELGVTARSSAGTASATAGLRQPRGNSHQSSAAIGNSAPNLDSDDGVPVSHAERFANEPPHVAQRTALL